MEGGTADSSGAAAPPPAAAHYSLPPSRFQSEDILFCVDVDSESRREMKLSGPKGRPITRLDAVKQALLLFVHSKLAINPDHRFALSVLSQSVSWVLLSLLFISSTPSRREASPPRRQGRSISSSEFLCSLSFSLLFISTQDKIPDGKLRCNS